jgi:tryptophan synthase alpha chain
MLQASPYSSKIWPESTSKSFVFKDQTKGVCCGIGKPLLENSHQNARIRLPNIVSLELQATIYNASVPFHFESKPALVAYLTCGDPDLATTRAVILAAIEAGASIIELGVPFSDPLADGPVIQRASERALKHGTSLQQVLTLASEIREHSQSVGLVIFSYLNPILRMGLAKFCQVARLAGVDGTLITDLPIEEAANYLREARKNDLATIFLAAPTSTDQRLQMIAKVSTGFIYAISRTGVTGARQEMTGDAKALIKRIRHFSKLPVAVGFGISTPEQFAAVGKFAEGAVIGSAIVQIIEQNPGREAKSVGEFVGKLSTVSHQPSALPVR